jgi:hypothetical protein
VYRVSFYVNGFGVCRAGVFAGTAAHTNIRIYNGQKKFLFVWAHIHSLGRTMFGTGTTICSFCKYNTIVLDKHYFSKLKHMLIFNIKRSDSTGRAYFATDYTVEIAIVRMIIKAWLHKSGKPVFNE